MFCVSILKVKYAADADVNFVQFHICFCLCVVPCVFLCPQGAPEDHVKEIAKQTAVELAPYDELYPPLPRL
jgi:hypothetical protein